MTRIIPRELIKHLEWRPGQEPPQPTPVTASPMVVPVGQHDLDIEVLVTQGKAFYDDSLPTAFRKASEYAAANGIVASMPYHLAGKATADKRSYLWKNWFTMLTEEDVGIDTKGKIVSRGKPILITVHGGGILTPDKIQQAYDEGLTEHHAAKFTEKDIVNLLDGMLPNGEHIELYNINDVKNGRIPHPFGRYAVVMDFATAKATQSGYFSKRDFMENPLVLARAGTLEHLDNYFEKAKGDEEKVANWHSFASINSSQPQGRLLFLDYLHGGLYGSGNLGNYGRFVGVAPEAPKSDK